MRIIRNAAACASGGESKILPGMHTLRINLPRGGFLKCMTD